MIDNTDGVGSMLPARSMPLTLRVTCPCRGTVIFTVSFTAVYVPKIGAAVTLSGW